jgi:O-antigen/teichoic acid export membrane protein
MDAFALQLATIVNNNVDTVILTLMVSMREISVYTVYYMVVHNINKLITSAINGFKAAFGDMMAKGEAELLRKRFLETEWALFAGASAFFSVTAILLTPFVMLYTRKVLDVNYNRYGFGLIMTCVHMLTVVRIPFQQIVEAAGHFKQTKNGAIMEVVFNVVFSLIFAYFYGITGVLLGTAVAALIRTTQFGYYACKKILHIPIWHMIKNYLVYFGAPLSWCLPVIFLSRKHSIIICSGY